MSEPGFPRGIMASCCVPWDADFQFMEGVFRRLVRDTLGQTDLVYVFGTAGEGYAVRDEQFEAIARVFCAEMADHGAAPIVGVIGTSLSEVQGRIALARGYGARRFMVTLPPWGVCTPAEVLAYFEGLCGAFPDCAFVHYNLKRAGRLVEPEEYADLAKRHPNLVATKNSNDSTLFLMRLFREAPSLRHFITEPGFPMACHCGPAGLLISLASINWQTGKRFYEAGCAKDTATAVRLLAEQRDILACLVSLPEFDGHIDGVYDKLFAKLNVPDFPLRLLPPYAHPGEQVYPKLLAWLREHYPHWAPD